MGPQPFFSTAFSKQTEYVQRPALREPCLAAWNLKTFANLTPPLRWEEILLSKMLFRFIDALLL